MTPQFPLYVKFDDGEEWRLETPEEVETSLEWFDSEDGDTSAEVFDAQGRRVILKVEALKVIRCLVEDTHMVKLVQQIGG